MKTIRTYAPMTSRQRTLLGRLLKSSKIQANVAQHVLISFLDDKLTKPQAHKYISLFLGQIKAAKSTA